MILDFSDEQIQQLFGHEAAEDEDVERLKKYYFKRDVYDQIVCDLPLRILVGHKGIGKSALFKVAMSEDEESKRITLLIKPDDILNLEINSTNFLKQIRDWKVGLTDLIIRKTIEKLKDVEVKHQVEVKRGLIIEFLRQLIQRLKLNGCSIPLVDHFLNSPIIIVYIDDLDRGWQGRKEDIISISAMLNAVRDLTNENKGLRIRIGLRSDVFYLVRTSDESTDKIENSVVWLKWTNHEIFAMLVKRIETFFGRQAQEQDLLEMRPFELAKYLKPVMEERFQGLGKWENAPMYRILMSLIRKRPRDLVKLCTLAAKCARNARSNTIMSKNFQDIFEEYSHGRLQDTINEYRSELPEIERLLTNMKPSRKERTAEQGYTYTSDQLLKKIRTILERGQFVFQNGKVADVKELAAFLYKINFLTARKETSEGIIRKYFEENQYLSAKFVDFGFSWEIHPAYRWALQPDKISEICSTLELSSDEPDGDKGNSTHGN